MKDWSDIKGHFVRLRTELETFLYQMKVNPSAPRKDLDDTFDALRTRFGEGLDRKKVDPLNVGIEKMANTEALKNYEALRIRTASAAATT